MTLTRDELQDHDNEENRRKHEIEFFIPGLYSSETLNSPKEPFYFVSLFVKFEVIIPRFPAIGFWRNTRSLSKIDGGFARFVALVTLSMRMLEHSISSGGSDLINSRPRGPSAASPLVMEKGVNSFRISHDRVKF